MFESLSARLQDVFKSLRSDVRLTPESVESALRELRLALLEADVNFKVVKAFVDRVRDRAVDQQILKSLTPSQQVVRVVRDELLALFGDMPRGLSPSSRVPRVLLLLGLQGSGKTTTAAKLARRLSGEGRHPLLVSTDVRRPAAVDQLAILGAQAGVRVHSPAGAPDAVTRARGAVDEARDRGLDVVIVDTAGRLHVDEELMAELDAIKAAVEPSDRLYVADAMTGQDAIKSAGEFHRRVGLTGVVLSKMDGDARGGAALSVVSVVGVPITFIGSGERLDDLEPFHPERVVSRMLGMGDVLSLVEKAERAISHERATQLEQKIRRADFTLEDFRDQLDAIKQMGPLEQLIQLMPGMGALPQGASGELHADRLTRVEAMINSMTPKERRNHQLISGSRRRRIARGSGTTVEDLNRLLKQFVEMRKMLKRVGGGGRRGKSKKVRHGHPRFSATPFVLGARR